MISAKELRKVEQNKPKPDAYGTVYDGMYFSFDEVDNSLKNLERDIVRAHKERQDSLWFDDLDTDPESDIFIAMSMQMRDGRTIQKYLENLGYTVEYIGYGKYDISW